MWSTTCRAVPLVRTYDAENWRPVNIKWIWNPHVPLITSRRAKREAQLSARKTFMAGHSPALSFLQQRVLLFRRHEKLAPILGNDPSPRISRFSD